MKQGRVMRNTEGAIRTVECGKGIYELVKEPDVLEIIPVRSRKNVELITVGTLAMFVAAAVALIVIAPAFGVLLFAVVAWTLFAAIATGEEDE